MKSISKVNQARQSRETVVEKIANGSPKCLLCVCAALLWINSTVCAVEQAVARLEQENKLNSHSATRGIRRLGGVK